MCSALSALILAVAYFIIIFQDSITFHTFVFFLFVAFVCVMIIGSSLKINFFQRLCFYECRILLNRCETSVILLLLVMMYPFWFTTDNKLQYAGTIIALISGAISFALLMVWVVMRLCLLYHYSV